MKTSPTNILLRRGAILLGTSLFFLASCQKTSEVDPTTDTAETGSTIKTSTWNGTATVGAHEETGDYVWNASDVIPIKLNGTSITVGGAGATASGSVVTIGSAGTYSLSGSLTNGQVIVNTKDKAVVRLILDGVNIHSSVNAPVYVKKAENVVLILADNSTNVLTDAATYTYDVPADEEPSAAVFSKSNLTIYGNGSLDVTGNFGDGIVSKDGDAALGYVIIDKGDGLDANGSIVMTGGVVIVAGPAASGNGALDYDATADMLATVACFYALKKRGCFD